jgi:hypothetical protein
VRLLANEKITLGSWDGITTPATTVVAVQRHSAGADHVAVCGLLMERMQDVSSFFISLYVDDCGCDLFASSGHAISLMKAAAKFIADEGTEGLRKRVAELGEENSRLQALSTELWGHADKPTAVVVALRQELDNTIKDHDLLKDANATLLMEQNMLRDQRLLILSQSLRRLRKLPPLMLMRWTMPPSRRND